MKYLKLFNEQMHYSIEELTEICDTCFAYLYDDGFYVEIKENKIWIVKENDGSYFYWSEIKDSFLSLMSMIDNIDEVKMYHYQLSHMKTKEKFVVYKRNSSWDSHPLDKLEEIMSRDDAYGNRSRISKITIYLK